MTRLLGWAWPFLATSVLFEAYSYQLFYNSLNNVGFLGNIMFSIGIVVGDMPAIIIVAAITVGIYWVFVRSVSWRLVALSLGVGCISVATIIRPLMIAHYTQ